jgi:hypothetical protein
MQPACRVVVVRAAPAPAHLRGRVKSVTGNVLADGWWNETVNGLTGGAPRSDRS